MAKYTTTIKALIDNNFDFKMISYPIFDENYREILNNKILNHYYLNEIGFETASLFRFYLNNKMNEIMPYYNELYKAQAKILNENLFNNVNLTENYKSNNSNETNTLSISSSNSNGENNSKNLFNDTPQGKIYQGSIDDSQYATNVTFDKNTNTNSINDESSSTGNASSTENYIKTIIGNNGNRFNIDILNDIKEKLMNIDMLIINNLEELFMQIY